MCSRFIFQFHERMLISHDGFFPYKILSHCFSALFHCHLFPPKHLPPPQELAAGTQFVPPIFIAVLSEAFYCCLLIL